MGPASPELNGFQAGRRALLAPALASIAEGAADRGRGKRCSRFAMDTYDGRKRGRAIHPGVWVRRHGLKGASSKQSLSFWGRLKRKAYGGMGRTIRGHRAFHEGRDEKPSVWRAREFPLEGGRKWPVNRIFSPVGMRGWHWFC